MNDSENLTFQSSGNPPTDFGQSVLTALNPYKVFGGTVEEADRWRKDNQAVASITEGEPGTTPLAVFLRESPEHPGLHDWVVYGLAPYRTADRAPFIAIPLGHGTTDVIGATLRASQLVGVLRRAMFTALVTKVYPAKDGRPVAAVVVGSGYGPVKGDGGEGDDGDEARPASNRYYVPHNLFYPIGITEAEGVKLIEPMTVESASFEDAQKKAEEFFQKATQV